MTPLADLARAVAAVGVAALAVAGAAPAATVPTADTAPGRVVISVDDGAVRGDVDAAYGIVRAVGLDDGSAILLGQGAGGRGVLYLARIGPGGALDRTFGHSGVTSFAVAGGSATAVIELLAQPDGKVMVIGAALSAPPVQVRTATAHVMRFNTDGSLDRSYGTDGTATAEISPSDAALAPDGALVLSGTTGDAPPPPSPSTQRWALTRLTPAGAVDAAFGSGAVVTIPTAAAATGSSIAIAADGAIVAEGVESPGPESRLLLTRLTPHGAPDPSFAGGSPVVVPLSYGTGLIVHDDGAVVLAGARRATGPSGAPMGIEMLARYTAAGIPDPAHGSGGFASIGPDAGPSQILPLAGHAVLVIGPGPVLSTVRLVTAAGAVAKTRTIRPPFGGGTAAYVANARPTALSPLVQNGFFSIAPVVARAGGGYLLAGTVSVSQPNGEGTGFSTGRVAAAALTSSLALDTTFGGPATAPALTVALAPQRASTARRRHHIRLRVRSSRVGLALVKVTHEGRALAHSVLPIFKTGPQRIPIELTRHGNTYLRRHRNVRVTVTATGRDLLTSTVSTTAHGRLR